MSKLWRVLLLSVFLVMSVPFTGVAGATDGCGCTTCGTWQEYPLYAGQTWQVGVIRINNCLDKVGVEYVLFDSVTAMGWKLTETHLAIATSVSGIPQTKTGNPIPGAFPYSRTYEDGVVSDMFCIDRPASWATGTELIVAAHAVVKKPATSHTEYGDFCISSGANTKLGDAVTPATATWVHPLWNSSLRNAADDSVSDLYNYASWVWDAYYNPSPRNGDMVDLYHEFNIPDGATITAATLKIAADNAFSWKLNAGTYTDVNLAGDWRSQTVFTYPTYVVDPNMSAWKKVYTYDVASALSPAANALYVTGVNAAWNTDDPTVNPAGVLYQLCGSYSIEVSDNNAANDTAWGGTNDFRGKNWAKYIKYTIQECCTPCCTAPFYPFEVIGSSQGLRKNGTPVVAARSNPDAILTYSAAAVESSFFSLGYGGWITGRYECRVPNGEGNDIVVVEDTWGTYPLEQAKVWVSQDGATWYYLGMANNLARVSGDGTHTWSYFDFDDAVVSDTDPTPVTLGWIQYVKVVDATNPGPLPADSDGFDLNTIRALHDGLICQ